MDRYPPCPDCRRAQLAPTDEPLDWTGTWWGATTIMVAFAVALIVCLLAAPWSAGFPAAGVLISGATLVKLAREAQPHVPFGGVR